MKKILLVAFLFALSTVNAHAGSCTVYKHAGFKGPHITLPPGARMSFVGEVWNDQISSVVVRRSCRLLAYRHADFRGRKLIFNRNTRFVGNRHNDQISSMVCDCADDYIDEEPIDYDDYDDEPTCKVFEHADLQGRQLKIRGRVKWVGDRWNDTISSATVPRGCRLKLFEHRDFRGRVLSMRQGNNRWVGDRWNDKASSAICTCR